MEIEKVLTKLAQVPHYPGSGSPVSGIGAYGNPQDTAPTVLNDIISVIIGLMTGIAGIWFFFMLITGAISWIGAEGDRGKIEAAKSRITMALIGIVIVVASLFVVQIVGNLLGFQSILDPGGLIESGTLGP